MNNNTDPHQPWGAELRAFREAIPWTRERFAHEINAVAAQLGEPASCSARQVARWEDGETAAPGTRYSQALRAIGAPLPAAPQANGNSAAAEPSEAFEEDPMRRRTVLGALSTLALGAGPAGATLEAVRQGLDLALGMERATSDWLEMSAEYARDFFTSPPAQIVADLTSDLLVLQHRGAAETNIAYKRDLQRAGAEMSVVMAMGLASLGEMRQARRWWASARGAADRSGALDTQLFVRDWEAVNGLYEGRPTAAILKLCDEGVALGAPPCAGLAGLLAGRAQTLAVQGRKQEAVAALHTLDDVTGCLDSATLADADSMHGWPEFRVRYTESYTYTKLGMTEPAYAAQARALDLYPPEMAREQAQLDMHRAACLVQDGDVGGGLAHAHTALDRLPATLHNALLYQIGGQVLDVLPTAERSRPDAGALRDRLSSVPA